MHGGVCGNGLWRCWLAPSFGSVTVITDVNGITTFLRFMFASLRSHRYHYTGKKISTLVGESFRGGGLQKRINEAQIKSAFQRETKYRLPEVLGHEESRRF
jgi:hypothetical protein